MENFTRLSISLNTELLLDINFHMMKLYGVKEPKNSYGQYFEKMLRDRVPHRNPQNTEEESIN